MGVKEAGDSDSAFPLRSNGLDWSTASSARPGDEGVLAGGVSDARLTLSWETIDWSAADASDSGGDSPASVGRAISGFVSRTCVEFARGGNGGGTRAGCGGICTFVLGSPWPPSAVGVESWSRPVKPVWDTSADSFRSDVELAADVFQRRMTLCSGAFFGS